MLNKAIQIAALAHEGQYDKAGKPYILHPLRVMLTVEGGIKEQCTAILHDVIEDTTITIDYLRKEGFDENILSALFLLTRTPDMDYMEYVKRLRGNAIAKAVKLADLNDNMDLSRIENPTQHDYNRLDKYMHAKKLLLNN